MSVSMRYGPEKKRRMLYCGTCKSRFSERKRKPLFDTRLQQGGLTGSSRAEERPRPPKQPRCQRGRGLLSSQWRIAS